MSENTVSKVSEGFQQDGSFLVRGLATPKIEVREGEKLKVSNVTVNVALPKFTGIKDGKIVARTSYTNKVVNTIVSLVAECYKGLNSTTFGKLAQTLSEELARNPWLVVLLEGLTGELAIIRTGDKVKVCSAVSFADAFRFIRLCKGEVEEEATADGLPESEQEFE